MAEPAGPVPLLGSATSFAGGGAGLIAGADCDLGSGCGSSVAGLGTKVGNGRLGHGILNAWGGSGGKLHATGTGGSGCCPIATSRLA